MEGARSTGKKNDPEMTLHKGRIPQPEKVRQAMEDKECLKKSRMYNERSEKGGANPMAYPGCKK